MADQKWEKQIKDFIKRTGDELKRTGEELKVEAQRLLDEVKDPGRQAKVKETLRDWRDKASSLTKDAAEKLDSAVRKVEGAVENALDLNKGERGAKAAPAASAPSSKPASSPKPARKSGKTIGKKAGAKKAAGPKAPAKKAPKSIGRKKPPA
jgi:hypothetical protein